MITHNDIDSLQRAQSTLERLMTLHEDAKRDYEYNESECLTIEAAAKVYALKTREYLSTVIESINHWLEIRELNNGSKSS